MEFFSVSNFLNILAARRTQERRFVGCLVVSFKFYEFQTHFKQIKEKEHSLGLEKSKLKNDHNDQTKI